MPTEPAPNGRADEQLRLRRPVRPGQTEFHVPARLSAAESKAVTEAAVTAHRVLALRDISRADLIISAGRRSSSRSTSRRG